MSQTSARLAKASFVIPDAWVQGGLISAGRRPHLQGAGRQGSGGTRGTVIQPQPRRVLAAIPGAQPGDGPLCEANLRLAFVWPQSGRKCPPNSEHYKPQAPGGRSPWTDSLPAPRCLDPWRRRLPCGSTLSSGRHEPYKGTDPGVEGTGLPGAGRKAGRVSPLVLLLCRL